MNKHQIRKVLHHLQPISKTASMFHFLGQKPIVLVPPMLGKPPETSGLSLALRGPGAQPGALVQNGIQIAQD